MKPDDRNGARPAAERPYRVLLNAASERRQYNCTGVDSKARTLMLPRGARAAAPKCRGRLLTKFARDMETVRLPSV